MNTINRWPKNLQIDEVQTSGSLAIFAVRGGNGQPDPNDYLPLTEALEMGLARITEVSHHGSVPTLRVENRAKLPVLGIQGEEFKGAKQNRTLNVTLLAKPGVTDIPVTCVEMGRWSWAAPEFVPGHMESPSLRQMKSRLMHVMRRNQDAAGTPVEHLARFGSDQGMVWKEVADQAAAYGVSSRTRAMSDIYENRGVGKSLDEITGAFHLPEDARGCVVSMGGELVIAEVFESRTVFRRIWPRLVKSYGLQSLRCREKAVPDRWKVLKFLDEPNGHEAKAEPSVSLGEDLHWREKDFTASALEWKERVLHGVVFPA